MRKLSNKGQRHRIQTVMDAERKRTEEIAEYMPPDYGGTLGLSALDSTIRHARAKVEADQRILKQAGATIQANVDKARKPEERTWAQAYAEYVLLWKLFREAQASKMKDRVTELEKQIGKKRIELRDMQKLIVMSPEADL